MLSDPPWHKHHSDNTGSFPLNEDDKNLHYLPEMEGKILFRIVKNIYLLIDLYFKHF